MTPLMAAVVGGNYRAISMLVAAGAPVNATDEGATALVLAVARNDPFSARALLDAGADSSLRFRGRTLIDIARAKGFREIENLLLHYRRRAA